MAILDTLRKMIDEARVLLQDTKAPFRYEDRHFVMSMNSAVLEARRLRPDLFLSTQFVLPEFITAEQSTAPIEPMYRTAFVYYLAGRAQLIDDEAPQDGRATVFLNKFVSQLAATPS